jgi:hypothetical protein
MAPSPNGRAVFTTQGAFMFRRLTAGLCAVTVLGAGSAAAALANTPTPVLGYKHAFINGAGFGAARPKEVYLGGDPTGLVRKLVWSHWSSRTTVGRGTGWCPGQDVADGRPCPAVLRASNLGSCHGHLAYHTLQFYFQIHTGRLTKGSRWSACA